MEPNAPSSVSSVRTTKRKLEDAIRSLDGAVVSASLATMVERPTPSKRLHLARSVYSTLGKFGVTLKERSQPSFDGISTIDVSKSAPHLSAILARSASQPKQAPSFSHPLTPSVHPASEYRPSSTESFLSRLATYKITTYANKPPQIDAVAAAKCGWINDGKDRLVCGICDMSWVLASREGMNKDAASALVEKQRASLVEMHKDGCPWKSRQCESSVYRVSLQAPTAMVRDLRATALSLEPVLVNVAIKHPLTPEQLGFLRSIFSVAVSERSVLEHEPDTDISETARPTVPSDTAVIVALFGWVPATTATLHRATLFSRTASFGPSASVPPTPSLSRTNSISNRFHERASTPTPSASASMSISQFTQSPDRIRASSRTKDPSNHLMTASVSRDASLVYCILCQRRVGLWSFVRNKATPLTAQDAHSAPPHEHQKEFDIVKEHRSYCPYVVRSSVVPSISYSPVVDPPGNAVEGWRAVLTVVQRHELSQRQRLSRFVTSKDPDSQASSMDSELKGIEAMVAGVKTNGGRDLLRYIRTLLA